MPLTAMLACLILQNTWVVDDGGGPGVNFTDIPPAIAAADDGDILLVQPGTYSHFTVTGKGLRILGSGASGTIVGNPDPLTGSQRTTLADVPVSSVAYLEGVRFTSSPVPGTSVAFRVTVTGSTSRVAFSEVEIHGPMGPLPCLSPPALRVDGAEVEVSDSLVQGGDGATSFGMPFSCCCAGNHGGGGLEAMNGARVHVASSVVLGGEGENGSFGPSPPGGAGGAGLAVLSSSQVWVADSIVRGGDGGCDPPSNCGVGGAGILAGGGAFVRVSGDAASLVQGGNNGGSPFCGFGFCTGAGIDTFSLSLPGAVVVVHSVPVVAGTCAGSPCNPAPAALGAGVTLNAPLLPVLRVSGTLTTTGTATITLSNGLPNAAYIVAFAAAPGFLPGAPFFLGEILLDPVNWYLLAIGSLAPAGDVALTLPLTGIPPGFVYLPVYLQGLAFDQGGFWRMSNSTVAAIRP